jgi:amino acid adenylation domain-containing protein
VRAFSLEAYAHQDVPFEKLVEELIPQRSIDITPLFQVMFIFQNVPKQVFQIQGLEMEDLAFDTGVAKFDLSSEVYEDDEKGDLHWRFEYNTDLFEKATIRRMIEHFRNLLHAVLENPDRPLVDITLMSAGERDRTIVELNDTAIDFAQAPSVQSAFELQASRTPDSVAVVFQNERHTYRQINERANRLAHHLINRGVRPGNLVGVSFKRSPQTIIGLLGVLKAGAAYVPLDPTYPAQWLSFVIEDSQLWGAVTDRATRKRLPSALKNVVVLDANNERSGGVSSHNPGLSPSNDDRAYVLYTSGSTGMPKGVEGTHRACLNRFAWMWREYPFQAGEVCCQKTNLGFVDSVWEIFGPLLVGMPNVIIPQESLRDPEELLSILAREHITRIVLVPSLLRMLLDHAPNLQERVPELKLWSSSGEVLPTDLVERFRVGFPAARLLNLYGSAEVAADVTCHEVSDEDLRANSIPIGRPISNTQVYILDGKRNPVPMGVRGEIYAGGENLARGYWRRPELTAERFVENPIDPRRSPRLYRTGDLGRYKVNGEIEYLGRVDSQVKLRGMRLELGEVEAVLATHPGVREAVVAVTTDQQRLAAYVTVANGNGQAPSAGELRRYLRARLPEHMVPGSYSRLEQWPLLPSGKVDRKAVLAASALPLADYDGLVAPRNEVEHKLAAIWQELLKLEQVGIEQNFFELGGHSLLALQVMARIRSQFEVELPVRSLFEEPTLAALATAVEKAQAQGLKARTPILQRRSRPTATPAPSPEALLAELDNLSATELQSLLQRVLQGKPSVS